MEFLIIDLEFENFVLEVWFFLIVFFKLSLMLSFKSIYLALQIFNHIAFAESLLLKNFNLPFEFHNLFVKIVFGAIVLILLVFKNFIFIFQSFNNKLQFNDLKTNCFNTLLFFVPQYIDLILQLLFLLLQGLFFFE